jgi:hypothetical protein
MVTAGGVQCQLGLVQMGKLEGRPSDAAGRRDGNAQAVLPHRIHGANMYQAGEVKAVILTAA